jgi:hypothetical protein
LADVDKLTIPNKARFEFRTTELIGHVRAEYEKRLLLACEETKTYIQKKVREHSTLSEGPSSPGDFAHAITGHYSRSIFWEADVKQLRGIVGTNLDYGLFLEFGVHGGKIIYPKTPGGVLSWVGRDGVRRFAKWIKMGAIEARPSLRLGMSEMTPRLKQIFEAKLPDLKGAVHVG